MTYIQTPTTPPGAVHPADRTPSRARLVRTARRHALGGLVAAGLAGAVAAQPEPTVYVQPEVARAPVGGTVDVAVDVRDADNVGAFQLTLGFPAGLLAYEGITVGPFVGQTGRPVRALPPIIQTGSVTLAVTTERGAPGASGSGTLARVRFTAIDAGEGPLDLVEVLLSDADNGNRMRPRATGGRVVLGPIVTPTPTPIRVALPMAFLGVGRDALPPPATAAPASATPTAPPATVTPTPTTPPPATPTGEASPVPSPTATVAATPTPDKPAPKLGELQCRTTNEWVSIVNTGGAALDLEGWMLFSTTGIQTYTFDDPYVLEPGASVYLHSGPQAPRTEGNRIRWTQNYIWNEVDGDTAQLKSPRPNSVVIDTKDCE
ncbi:hypothetical protein DCC79_14905 [bacterium]|nr:MAG: hypothetical protein DCC79_14905 [bacterium]